MIGSTCGDRLGPVLLAVCALDACPGCRSSATREAAPTPSAPAPTAALVAGAPGATGAASGRHAAGPRANSGDFRSRFKHETVSMLLPQPEPEPDLGDGTFDLPQVSLPGGVEIVLGSTVVESTRDPKRSGTLVNIWATWCGPCEAEMPMLMAVERRYAKRGIAVTFVSVDDPADAAAAHAKLQQYGATGPTWIAHPELGYFKRAISPIWPGALPATFLFDDAGRLRYYWGAQIYERELTPVLDAFLDGEPIDGLANLHVQAPG